MEIKFIQTLNHFKDIEEINDLIIGSIHDQLDALRDLNQYDYFYVCKSDRMPLFKSIAEMIDIFSAGNGFICNSEFKAYKGYSIYKVDNNTNAPRLKFTKL